VRLTIGELAEQSGVTAEAIRYYEREGVIPVALRTGAGQYRQYGSKDAQRLRFIRRARDLGFSLSEVRELLSLAEAGPAHSCMEVNRMSRAHLAAVDEKIEQLVSLRRELARVIGDCDGKPFVTDCRILDALNGHPG
jgi:DNA-binding transcriptional MerR regulator